EKLYKETEKLMKMPPNSHEAALIRTYLDTCLDLPWNTRTKDRLDLDRAKKQLDHDHHGLQKVKERILELLAVRMLNPDSNSQIICLVGPPGVGKTSIARSIATSIGKKYTRISLGGVRDESDIRGHRKTYIGAMPGRIINAMKVVDSKNPLILLDEIDKMSSDFRGDPASAMLEVLDSEQNSEFRDHYIEVPFDLSEVLFLTTANTTSTIPAPLLDRMDVIELGSYTREEKFNIAKRHLIKKQLKKHGLTMSKARITDSAIYSLIDGYTKEAGVRSLEREIAALLRKAARIIVSGKQKSISFTANNIEKYLGPKKYLDDELSKQDEIGAVNGLAWTSVGGVLMPLEVLVLDGKGKIELTGSLGDVMKESAKIAVSYARSIAKEYCIDVDFYKNKDIHIHAPEGAVPKDGPSAGIALTTAIISALSNIAVRRDIAMTGEVTLRGKVLPIGGLREKAMAAYKSGVKKVIIPKGNEADLTEVDDVVRENIEFVLVDDVKTVLEQALVSPNFCIKKIEHTGGMHKAQIDAIIKPITDKENATINS
ncbi:MAG: endopeptidase La, partial [Clostridiales bacterium]|nr:endopeptidase La [Clostridiales bacterium]